MKSLFKLLLFGCVIFQTACGADKDFKRGQARVAEALEKIPASEIRLFLYSLDPHDVRRFEGKLPENSENSFHWMPVLGVAEVTSASDRLDLLTSLAGGIRESSGLNAACFDPRHGLRIISKFKTNKFVSSC